MAFDFRAFYRFTVRLLSRIRDGSFGWTPRRAAIFLALYLLYPLFEFLIWLHLLLDDLLFRAYRQRIVTEFADIFDRFDFDPGEPVLPCARPAEKRPAPGTKRHLRQKAGLSPGSRG